MQFSLVDGLKAAPFPKGVGVCQACGNRTQAKCGSQKVWHWAHANRESCDSWWENETPWHRAWKSHWPIEYKEVVHVSSQSGEKHIADVKNAVGFVLEFQNSPMNDAELLSREAFYGNMAWVVNGESFLKNIEFGPMLPDPQHPVSQDMRVYPPRSGGQEFMYYLASENEPGASMVEVHSSRKIRSLVEQTHIGHRLFIWKHSRDIWFRSTVPVYLDFGGDVIWQITRFNAGSAHCLMKTNKSAFIMSNGGYVGA